jgi:hypothetical protein
MDNGHIIILDEGDEYYFKSIPYPGLTTINKYGHKGNGPHEIGFAPVFSNMKDNMIEFFDFRKSSLFTINLEQDNSAIELELVLPPDLIEAQIVMKVNTTTGFGAGGNDGRVFFLNSVSGEIKFFPFLSQTKKLPNQHLRLFNDGLICCSPNREIAIFASKYFQYFDIFSSDGKLVRTFSEATMDNQVFMENGMLTSDNTKLYYSSVYATEKYFYLLYLGGQSYNDLMKNIQDEKFICEIQQYDFHGNPQKCFVIKTPIKSFCIDEKNSKILIINPLSEEYPLMEFRMD